MKTIALLFFILFSGFSYLNAQTNLGRLPRAFKDLSEHAPMRYNLTESELFQPIHFDFRGEVPFVILGRFQGELLRDQNSFNLTMIELAMYTTDTKSGQPPSYLVDKAFVDSSETNDKELHISLYLISEDKLDATRKYRRLNEGLAECLVPLHKVIIPRDGRIYFTIKNYDDIAIAEDDEGNKYVEGRHCNGVPVFPPGGQY